jgi:hypothetical protein
MQARFPIVVFLACSVAVHTASAQQECGKPHSSSLQGPCRVKTEDYDVVVGSIKEGYVVKACGADGRAYLERHSYRGPSPSAVWSIVGVSSDGSIVTFDFPDMTTPLTAAVGSSGLNVVTLHSGAAEDHSREMYQFDPHGNLVAKRWLRDDFLPSQIAVLSSGKVIALRSRGNSDEDTKYDGAVLDADGSVLERFDLPLPPGGGGWTFASWHMAPGDGVAYTVLQSETTPSGPLTAIATISEIGQLDIKIIRVPVDNDQRHHMQWLFGHGVAVEAYHMVGERITLHFDEYDLSTGEKVASKMAHISGGTFGCYTGAEVSMLAHSAHVDPARGLSPDTLRLVVSKLR